MYVCTCIFTLRTTLRNESFLSTIQRGPELLVTKLIGKSLRETISFPFARFNWALLFHNTFSPSAITLEPSDFSDITHTLHPYHPQQFTLVGWWVLIEGL